jgi:hypothetical protein
MSIDAKNVVLTLTVSKPCQKSQSKNVLNAAVRCDGSSEGEAELFSKAMVFMQRITPGAPIVQAAGPNQ